MIRRLAQLASKLDQLELPGLADQVDQVIKPDLEPALNSLRPQMAAAAQRVYDEWQQEDGLDPELGSGGICDQISQALAGVASSLDVDISDAGQDGDDHAWIIVNDGKQAFEIDIPPQVYEHGSGYQWSRIPDVTIRPEDVLISPVPMGWVSQASVRFSKKRKPRIQTLKEHRTELTPEERKKVMDSEAVWHHGPGGKPSPAVWKSVIDGKTVFVCNTHRCFQQSSTLDEIIKLFHDVVKKTA